MPISQKRNEVDGSKPFCQLVTKINDETMPEEEIAAIDTCKPVQSRLSCKIYHRISMKS